MPISELDSKLNELAFRLGMSSQHKKLIKELLVELTQKCYHEGYHEGYEEWIGQKLFVDDNREMKENSE